MTTYAYIRVSTDGKNQTTDNQRKQIIDAGFAVDEFFSEDGVSGSTKACDRPVFAAMMDKLVENDTVIIVAIDRLGRSASDILSVIEKLKVMKVKVRVTQFDGVDVNSAMGKMIVTCMSAMAELERNMLVERTKAGLERTKAAGTKLGPPLTIEPELMNQLLEGKAAGLSLDKLSAMHGVPRNTIHRNVVQWAGKENEYAQEWAARKQQYAAKAA
jgi:DNA invertase Pin-like site-specific DNA recombinase